MVVMMWQVGKRSHNVAHVGSPRPLETQHGRDKKNKAAQPRIGLKRGKEGQATLVVDLQRLLLIFRHLVSESYLMQSRDKKSWLA